MARNPGVLFGMNADYNGLGIFVYKQLGQETFSIVGVFNWGMDYVILTEELMNV